MRTKKWLSLLLALVIILPMSLVSVACETADSVFVTSGVDNPLSVNITAPNPLSVNVTGPASLTGNTSLIYGYNGTAFNPIQQDSVTWALTTVDQAHHEIHEGDSYTVDHNAAGGSGTKATITFTTPNTAKWAHAVFSFRSNVEAIYTLGEGATVTAASGTTHPAHNQNRNSSKTSVLTPAGSAGPAGNVTLGATVTDFGETLEMLHFGQGRTGDNERGMHEWVLKQNTVYAVEVESQAASSEINVQIHWYEHQNK